MQNTIVIESHSQVMGFPVQEIWGEDDGPPPPHLASVVINGRNIEGFRAISPSTLHVVVFDPSQPPSAPEAILYNKALWQGNYEERHWGPDIGPFFDYMHNQILSKGDPSNLLFLIATSGFDLGMVPPPSFATFLFNCGAGPALQQWLAASPGCGSSWWVQTPMNYIFMGGSGMGFGKGVKEKFEVAAAGQQSLTTGLTIEF